MITIYYLLLILFLWSRERGLFLTISQFSFSLFF